MSREYIGTVCRLPPVGRRGDADHTPARYGVPGYGGGSGAAIAASFGGFQIVDVGKRVYRVGPGVYQMETREQVIARLSDAIFKDSE